MGDGTYVSLTPFHTREKIGWKVVTYIHIHTYTNVLERCISAFALAFQSLSWNENWLQTAQVLEQAPTYRN